MSKETIAHNVKLIREQQQLTQFEFAKKYHSNQKNISAYERGISIPNAEFVNAICTSAGITTDVFFSTKLQTNKEGHFNNLPKKLNLQQAYKKQLEAKILQLKKDINRFAVEIESIHVQMLKNL